MAALRAEPPRFDVVYDVATGSGAGEDYTTFADAVLKPGGMAVALNGGIGAWFGLATGWQSWLTPRRKMMVTNQNGTQLAEMVAGEETMLFATPSITSLTCEPRLYSQLAVYDVASRAVASTRPQFRLTLNSVSGLVSKVWYRIPFDQSELSISKIPPTDSPTVRPGRHP